MKSRQRRRAAFEEPSYWQSFSDMMAALLLIFILIIAITLMIYRQKTTDLEQTQLKLNAAQLELDNAKLNLDQSRKEIEASNKELADSLAELQIAYEKDAATTAENLMKLLMNHKMNQEDQAMEQLIRNTIQTVKTLPEEELKKIVKIDIGGSGRSND